MQKNLIILSIVLSLLASSYTQTLESGFNQPYQPAPTTGTAPADDKKYVPEASLNYIDSPLVDIVWCGEQKNVVFILTEKNTVYRSADDGFTGQKLNGHLEEIGKKEIISGGQVGQVSRFIQSPVDKNLMLFLGTEGINWYTEDCGATVKAMDQGRRVEDFHFHPTERTWLLATAWTVCDDFVNEPCRKYRELFFSKDLGDNWALISNYVYQFSWAMYDPTFFRTPKERILIAHEPIGRGHQNLNGWSDKLYVSYSDDFFNTTKTLVRGGNKFLLTHHFIFVVRVDNADEEEVTLLVGNPKEKDYKRLKPIELPAKHLFEHSYTILDSSEHAIFLHINHEGERSKYGNIYVSDSTGQRYALSLQGNVRDLDGQCDFERVQGLEGIYLANMYDKEELKRHKNAKQNDYGIDVQGPGSKKTTVDVTKTPGGSSGTNFNKLPMESFGKANFEKSIDDFKKTVISFDKGGLWQPLTPPDRDSQGNRIICKDVDCSLHLHSMSTTTFGPFYTTENSIGIILGTGNVGEYLSNRPDEINTYLSRDGGLTWEEIAKGSYIYEIGDHGAIIVMAPTLHSTKEVLYSWNEGLTWERLKISDTALEIHNIIIEPSNTAEKFVIYGRTTDMTDRGVLAAVDFFPLHQRWCVGAEEPNTPTSDYETWTPNGKISPHCLLGRKIDYIRKKREAECFNSEEVEQWGFQQNCQCTEEDWECDFGFYRKDLNSPCVSMEGKETNFTAPEECHGHYFVTQGYRKVAGDTCIEGVNHEALKFPCPGMSSLNNSNIVVFIALIAMIFGFVQLSKKGNTERFKDSIAEIINSILSIFKSSGSSKSGSSGYMKFDPEARNNQDDEDGFGGLVLEDPEEEPASQLEDQNLIEVAKGKKKAGSKALETADKRVPILLKPGERRKDLDLFQ